MKSYAIYYVEQYGMEPIMRKVFDAANIEDAIKQVQDGGVMLPQIIAVKLVLASSVIEGV